MHSCLSLFMFSLYLVFSSTKEMNAQRLEYRKQIDTYIEIMHNDIAGGKLEKVWFKNDAQSEDIEEWFYRKVNDSIQFFSTTYHQKKTNRSYTESYLLLQDQLVYASEMEQLFEQPFSNKDRSPFYSWSAYYYFRNEQMVDFYSLGHGKSELDDWHPESYIYEWYTKGENNNWFKF